MIAGHLGPDDSRYSRELLFLKDSGTVYQAMSIFLHHLQVNDEEVVTNHDEAEQRVIEFIRWKHDAVPPQVPFSDEELGRKS